MAVFSTLNRLLQSLFSSIHWSSKLLFLMFTCSKVFSTFFPLFYLMSDSHGTLIEITLSEIILVIRRRKYVHRLIQLRRPRYIRVSSWTSLFCAHTFRPAVRGWGHSRAKPWTAHIRHPINRVNICSCPSSPCRCYHALSKMFHSNLFTHLFVNL